MNDTSVQIQPEKAKDPFEHLLLKEYKAWRLYVHPNQLYLGRAYAWLRREGKVGIADLTWTPELWELFHGVVPQLREALKIAFQFDDRPESSDILNATWMANDPAHGHHGHMHFIPRFREPRDFAGVHFIDWRFGRNPTSSYESGGPIDKVVFAIRDELQRAFARIESPHKPFNV